MPIGSLIVRVIKAEGLAAADMNGKSDPFVKMTLVNQFHRTSTQYKTLNPIWNEMFHFQVNDINNQLDMWLYDEDRHGEDFLGRLLIPLLSVRHKKLIWYQLKDKKLQSLAKGRIQIRLDLEWSILGAALRTFTPLEQLKAPPPPVIKRSLMVSNFQRARTQIMILVEFLKYVKSCWQWESKLRSLISFLLFLFITYNIELWMVPLALASLLSFNLCLISSPRLRDLLGFDELKFSKITDVRFYDESTEADDQSLGAYFSGSTSATSETQSTTATSSLSSNSSCSIINTCNALRANCGLLGPSDKASSQITSSGSSITSAGISSVLNNANSLQQASSTTGVSSSDQEQVGLVERLSGAKDTLIFIQDLTGQIASYLERVSNTLTFKVPFLSKLMLVCLLIASLILYLIPVRYLVLAWGINKFTKKLRNPNYVDNNELIDFLSRVPDNLQCVQQQNIITY